MVAERTWKKRLRTVARATITAAALAGFVALAFAAHDWIVDEAAEQESLVACLIASNLEKVDRLAELIAAVAAVRMREAPDLTTGAETAAAAMGERLALVPYFTGLTILDAAGRPIADTRGPQALGGGASGIPAEAASAGRDGHFGPARREPGSDRLVLPIARQMIDGAGFARGLVVVWVDLERLYELFGAVAKLGDRATLVVRKDGVALFRLPPIDSFAAGSDMSNHPAFGLARAGEAQGSYVGISPIDGTLRILGFATTHDGDLIAVTSRTKKAMLREELLGRAQIVSVAALLAAMALGGSAYAALELRRRRRLLDRLQRMMEGLDLVEAGVAIADARTRKLVFVNKGFERLTGYAAAECAGLRIQDLHGPDTDPEAAASLRAAADAGETFRVDILSYRKSGTPFWSDMSIAPVRGPDGAIRAHVSALSDITGRVVLNARLSASFEAANAANRAKNSFLARMSHELRTPLNAVIGYAETMLLGVKGQLSEGHRGYARDIARSGRHLLAIVADVLEMARLEQGMRPIASVPFDPGLELHEAATMAGAALAANGATLELHTDGAPTALGDTAAFRRIAVNLIANAARHGRARGRIVAALSGDGAGRATLTVADDGPGFPKDVIANLGAPFVGARADTADKTGLGLGLAISVELAKRMGGDLRIENAAHGAVATLTLPAAIRETRAA